ncbi:heme peroxidase family protein [Halioxenophilus sp. WMMB6]|uniref:peroxidase family protein n=1 Tax=Halioxenophilus sp. WMMB6 TaxID=3073815 RepID=UPI00295F2E44|nr:heme peroxidase family protein [Halioxenophilus sp. WMMB6]
MKKTKPMHGSSKAKGCSHMSLGHFCELFGKDALPSWADEYGIKAQCEAEEVARLLGGVGGTMHDADNSSADSGIPAGYTFFAQFIDHDITLDTATKLHGGELSGAEIGKLPNLRSASLDLDCVYGFGPDASPFQYDSSQPGRMLVGSEVEGVENPLDLPRNSEGRALIGDPRNDENLFVSQLQLMFIRFHNRRLIGRSFEEAQRDVRYHYQYIVLNDYLERICDDDIYNFALPKIVENARKDPKDRDYPFCNLLDHCGRICMPVEFSVAAYRFGHTMVRSVYPVNEDHPAIELFDERFGTLGFGQVPPELVVDWRYLLDVKHCFPYVKSKAIDHLLADELIHLPDPVVGRNTIAHDRSLAFRNLLRGYVVGLACGQTVAKALKDKGYPINPNQDLKFDEIPGWHCLDAAGKKLAKHTPLFFYLMREAGVINSGEKLGPVASAILMEVFGTMLVSCDSYLKYKEHGHYWQPDPCVAHKDGELTLRDLVYYVNSEA